MALNETSTFDKVLTKRKSLQEAKRQIPWMVFNFLGASFVYFKMLHNKETDILWFAELVVFTVLTLNFVTGLILYIRRTFVDSPVVVSQTEKKIYSIKDSEPGFVTSTPVKEKAPTSPLPSPVKPPQALQPNESQLSTGGDVSLASSSWQFQKNQNSSLLNNVSFSSRCLDFDDEIVDERSLSFVFKDLEKETERASAQDDSMASLRLNQSGYLMTDYSPMKKYSYQLSTLSPAGTPSGKSPADESLAADGSSESTKTQDIWKQFGVNSEQLLQFTEKLRMWLTATILKPLVSEIDKINDSLTAHGLSDSRIGDVGLEKLRKTAQIIPVATNIPSLSAVLPYLEVTPHQDYLVHRLKELASGGCMSAFRWDGGSSYKNKSWDESLPTDSSIVLHCLSTYLDSQLPTLTDRPDKGPFSGHYLLKQTEKAPTVPVPLIVEGQLNPPHYKVILENQNFEFPKGRNNLLHTLLLFFFILKVRFSGQLGRINLGPSGLNILWVFDA